MLDTGRKRKGDIKKISTVVGETKENEREKEKEKEKGREREGEIV